MGLHHPPTLYSMCTHPIRKAKQSPSIQHKAVNQVLANFQRSNKSPSAHFQQVAFIFIEKIKWRQLCLFITWGGGGLTFVISHFP